MTATIYAGAKASKPAAKRARAVRPAATPAFDTAPMLGEAPAYWRTHERKARRLPLIAGGIAVAATIALVVGASRTARETEPFARTQTAPAAVATATPAPAASPDVQLIAPAPAPVLRQQARVTPRATAPTPVPLDANQLGQDASASVPATPAAPAPVTIPPVQTAPEAEAIPAPVPTTPEAAASEMATPAPM